eukprot:gb/GECH01006909.1/.p1 GENE.gb/GECH01006909.1/~~gb/GECH01006909.1/.p1  ORF type:complete len:114 (+),score=17.25 gb/GECH01006909.1/:1-342(+)
MQIAMSSASFLSPFLAGRHSMNTLTFVENVFLILLDIENNYSNFNLDSNICRLSYGFQQLPRSKAIQVSIGNEYDLELAIQYPQVEFQFREKIVQSLVNNCGLLSSFASFSSL